MSTLAYELAKLRFWMSGGPRVARTLPVPLTAAREWLSQRFQDRSADSRRLFGRALDDRFEIGTVESRRRGYALPLTCTLHDAGDHTLVTAQFTSHETVRLILQIWLGILALLWVGAILIAVMTTIATKTVRAELLLFLIPLGAASTPLVAVRSAVADAQRVADWFDRNVPGDGMLINIARAHSADLS